MPLVATSAKDSGQCLLASDLRVYFASKQRACLVSDTSSLLLTLPSCEHWPRVCHAVLLILFGFFEMKSL